MASGLSANARGPTAPTKHRPEMMPAVLAGIAGLAVLFVGLPIVGLLWRVPWSDIAEILGRRYVLDALALSAGTSLTAAGICLVLGLPLAWVLTNMPDRFRAPLRAILLLPMVLPPVVGGAALLFALGRNGLIGQWLARWWDVSLPFTTAGVVIAAVFISLPFFVVTVEAGMRQQSPKIAEAARTLGATRWRVFYSTTLPLITPSVLSGLALSWARALGEFGATITFAGNLPGTTQTLPLATFLALESGRIEEALALSVLLLGISAAVLILLRSRWLTT